MQDMNLPLQDLFEGLFQSSVDLQRQLTTTVDSPITGCIKRSVWSKEHVIRGLARVCESPNLLALAQNLDVYEFGVYRGETTVMMEHLLHGYQFPYKNLWGFDAFQGLPQEAPGVEKFFYFAEGVFGEEDKSLYQLRPNGTYIRGWFSDLTSDHVRKFNMRPAAFVHVDGDLYISCVQALTFMLENRLIQPGTVIAFDEFKSTSDLHSGGESRAWFELCDKYKIKAREFFRNIYSHDRADVERLAHHMKSQGVTEKVVLPDYAELWQNAFEVVSLGVESDPGLLPG